MVFREKKLWLYLRTSYIFIFFFLRPAFVVRGIFTDA